ncbi:MFS transporter [Pradoshia sp. D12]|uniref:MDR family MFS transporter n=1 Tax=Bacillaceae TaxID=186817 RepID=UPI00080AF690|nr:MULTISPECIES: MDR family MFS transporter [Bacillaceae]OCA89776.1 MFS transporter [Bacillus sp. FJAT-27986]QFK70828.1 MFS transporter [Pradoshia sp. D12]TPF72619.1 MFS transporter [Bacillus sp. D12]
MNSIDSSIEKKSFKRAKKKTKRPLVLISILLALFMGAIEGTIVSTAMPEIVGDLGGFSLYSWVFSAYLLMNTVTVLIYGKLSDLFGRKPVLLFGITVFLLGSLGSGYAWSMQSLIFFRLIQGFGAGAITPVAMTIVGDIYTKEERAKVQGYLSSVWGISAILGPAIGGLLIEYISWSWIFWINIPLGFLSLGGLLFFFHEQKTVKKQKVDYMGSAMLAVSLSLLMFLFVQGGISFSWLSLKSSLLIILLLILVFCFVKHENRTVEPVMPFSIWKNQSILFANLTSLTTGIVLIGVSSYLPTFVQGVMEESPMIAGFTLTAMSIGWPIASFISGNMILKIGYRTTCITGGIFIILGALAFTFLPSHGYVFLAASGSFLLGVGMGLTSTAFIVSIQSTVDWEQRGAATAANMFMRNLGNTIGAALLGGILNNRLNAYYSQNENIDLNSVNELLNTEIRSSLEPERLEQIQSGLTHSLGIVYFIVLLLAILSLFLILKMPKEKS